MAHSLRCYLLVILFFAFFALSFAQSESTRHFWSESTNAGSLSLADADIRPLAFRLVSLDAASLGGYLAQVSRTVPAVISVPLPDGTFVDFLLYESPVMEPGLAADFPEIRTFTGQSLAGNLSMKADMTPAGFHAMISGSGAVLFIDPVSRVNNTEYLVYRKSDLLPDPSRVFEEIDPILPPSVEIAPGQPASGSSLEFPANPAIESDGNRRTYRLAVAATGEYTAFHGGTVSGALAAITTTINRVNAIYERDLSIRLVLVNNNDQVIFTSTTGDPFTNNNSALLVNQSQSTLDALIGTANYDLGHTFSTGPGGLAALGVACFTGYKGQGVTGSTSPVGDPFAVDLVAHELAHQLGAHHTFNGSTGSCAGNRFAATAFEPGSGTTIMSYAGICSGQNIQIHSDDYFHAVSTGEIFAYTVSGLGNTCPVKTPVGNNPPTANAGTDYVIPVSTPFELTGTGTDPDGDPLTYTWEQYDLGAQGPPDDPNVPDGPIFRSVPPVTRSTRTFPQLSDILNQTTTSGEILPGIGRTLNFLFTVRDNHPGGGRVAVDTAKVEVAAQAGPFRVTGPNAPGLTWPGGAPLTVTWDVAGTTAAPVNCAKVDILLSVDGGLTFPYLVGSQLANSGNAFVVVPNIDATAARIKVKASGNIFFDISDVNFTIQKVTRPVVRFDNTDYTVSEKDAVGAGCERYIDLSIPVSLSLAPQENVIVNISRLPTSTGTLGEDYAFPNGTQLTFPAGDGATRQLLVRVADDAIHELEELLSLELTVADTLRAEVGKVNKTNVHIADDDQAMTANLAISTAIGTSRSFPFGANAVVHLFDETTGNLMLSLENQGAEDWGCVWVEMDRAGTGASPFWRKDPSHQFELMDKTFFVYAENQPAAGSYRVTLYYTGAEVDGWKTFTGNDWSDLEVVLSPGAISRITPDQPEPDGKVSIVRAAQIGRLGSNYQVSAVFHSFTGGLGVGKTGVEGFGLDWLSLNGKYEDAVGVNLEWATSQEQNMAYFVVERLEKGQGFVSVSEEISAAGFSIAQQYYSFIDSLPTEPYADYRIRAVFTNDSVAYSELLRVETAYPLVTAYPNPFTDVLKVFVEGEGPAILMITSATSGILYRQDWDISENSLVELPLENLPSGIYFYTVVNRGRSAGGMIIKNE
ncbi:MAG: M12 family metallo-peptidase [Bacteroidia bacterium]